MRRRLPVLIALATLAAGVGTATAAPTTAPRLAATTAAPAVSTVRLSVRIETTSDWTKVLLSPGAVAATRVTSRTTGTTVNAGRLGWEVRPLRGTGVVELDAVFDDAGSAASYAVELQKGAIGTAKVTVRNTTGTPYTALAVTSSKSSATDPSNATTYAVSRSALLGSRQLALPRADARRLTLAFYYPWFTGGYGSPQLAERPLSPRSTGDAAGVLAMTKQARAAGVDGFVVSWSGAARDGAEYDLALRAAASTAGVVAPYLETTEAAEEAAGSGRTTLQVVQAWLSEALDRSTSPAALKAGGESVVFVWDAKLLQPAEWAALLRTSRALGRPVRLVTDAHEPAYDGVSWGRHRYVVNEGLPALATSHRQLSLRAHAPAALDPATAPRLYAATASPGYDDTALRGATNPVVPRGSAGERYAGSWSAATASRPDWVLLNSWNEWYEGSSVEPGTESGDRALRQTLERARAFRASS